MTSTHLYSSAGMSASWLHVVPDATQVGRVHIFTAGQTLDMQVVGGLSFFAVCAPDAGIELCLCARASVPSLILRTL